MQAILLTATWLPRTALTDCVCLQYTACAPLAPVGALGLRPASLQRELLRGQLRVAALFSHSRQPGCWWEHVRRRNEDPDPAYVDDVSTHTIILLFRDMSLRDFLVIYRSCRS